MLRPRLALAEAVHQVSSPGLIVAARGPLHSLLKEQSLTRTLGNWSPHASDRSELRLRASSGQPRSCAKGDEGQTPDEARAREARQLAATLQAARARAGPCSRGLADNIKPLGPTDS